MKKRVMIWCSNEPMELRLTNEVNEYFNLVGIVIQKRPFVRNYRFKSAIIALLNKLLFYFTIDRAWIVTQVWYKSKYQDFPSVPKIYVSNINDRATYNFLNDNPCDLIAVSGTALVKKNLLNQKPSLGIINLHTGLSPYIKGGPNCTNWCISKRLYHLVGNTVMWLDEGIDSGNIITTKKVDLDQSMSLSEILRKVTFEGQTLYLDTIRKILSGEEVNNVPQKCIGEGITFFNKQWGYTARIRLVLNFYLGHYRRYINSKKYRLLREQARTICLNEKFHI